MQSWDYSCLFMVLYCFMRQFMSWNHAILLFMGELSAWLLGNMWWGRWLDDVIIGLYTCCTNRLYCSRFPWCCAVLKIPLSYFLIGFQQRWSNVGCGIQLHIRPRRGTVSIPHILCLFILFLQVEHLFPQNSSLIVLSFEGILVHKRPPHCIGALNLKCGHKSSYNCLKQFSPIQQPIQENRHL